MPRAETLADHLPILRARLERERRFRVEQLAELGADGPPSTPADAARRAVALKVAAAARQALADIDIALVRLATGRYGRCCGCGADIPLSLLRAVPATRWCLRCRRRQADHAAPRQRRARNMS